jgi:hypothetical protein
MPDRFQVAYQRAREKAGLDRWALLPIDERERALAEEMRKLDDEANGDQSGDLPYPV